MGKMTRVAEPTAWCDRGATWDPGDLAKRLWIDLCSLAVPPLAWESGGIGVVQAAATAQPGKQECVAEFALEPPWRAVGGSEHDAQREAG